MMYNKLPLRILERVKHEEEVREISITVNGKCQCYALTFIEKSGEKFYFVATIAKLLLFRRKVPVFTK